ncbi:Uncharacterized protein HZ326_8938 [Fusarium oxysporum f. sp. albedinis]|nr:Uncharacterized protein HZ326_8938 [Fusarium oxysporum f. sp. albedinis]
MRASLSQFLGFVPRQAATSAEGISAQIRQEINLALWSSPRRDFPVGRYNFNSGLLRRGRLSYSVSTFWDREPSIRS